MSRKNGTPPRSPFRSFPGAGQRPPIQQQLDAVFKGFDNMSQHLSEMALMLEFTMRQIRLTRTVKAGLITSASGKPEVQTLSLLQMFDEQREQFAEMLLKERAEAEEMYRAHADSQTTAGEGAGPSPDPSPSPTPDAIDHPTGPSLVLATGKGKGH